MALNGFQFQSNCLCRRDFILRKENTKCGARPYIFQCILCCTVIQRCQRKTRPIFKALFEHLVVAKISKEVGSTDTSISRLQQNEPNFL